MCAHETERGRDFATSLWNPKLGSLIIWFLLQKYFKGRLSPFSYCFLTWSPCLLRLLLQTTNLWHRALSNNYFHVKNLKPRQLQEQYTSLYLNTSGRSPACSTTNFSGSHWGNCHKTVLSGLSSAEAWASATLLCSLSILLEGLVLMNKLLSGPLTKASPRTSPKKHAGPMTPSNDSFPAALQAPGPAQSRWRSGALVPTELLCLPFSS